MKINSLSVDCKEISLNRRLELLGLSKSTFYYSTAPETEENLLIMNQLDKIYTDCPFYGSRRMEVTLKALGYSVNRKRVIRLMQKMGLSAIYPKKNLSKGNQEHKKYPYLLKGLDIYFSDQVWATDITYIPIKGGFLYLTAIIDWASRFIISWRLSNSLDVIFCLEALEEALEGVIPDIFNSDQGSQYTCRQFIEALESKQIKISMDGVGRCMDNIIIERFWRSLKYEDVYIKRYESGLEAHQGISNYIEFYNDSRPHQSLGYKTPHESYINRKRQG